MSPLAFTKQGGWLCRKEIYLFRSRVPHSSSYFPCRRLSSSMASSLWACYIPYTASKVGWTHIQKLLEDHDPVKDPAKIHKERRWFAAERWNSRDKVRRRCLTDRATHSASGDMDRPVPGKIVHYTQFTCWQLVASEVWWREASFQCAPAGIRKIFANVGEDVSV